MVETQQSRATAQQPCQTRVPCHTQHAASHRTHTDPTHNTLNTQSTPNTQHPPTSVLLSMSSLSSSVDVPACSTRRFISSSSDSRSAAMEAGGIGWWWWLVVEMWGGWKGEDCVVLCEEAFRQELDGGDRTGQPAIHQQTNKHAKQQQLSLHIRPAGISRKPQRN